MSMVEKVARAIDPVAFMPGALGDGFAVRRLKAMDDARAAIEAMREPSEGMRQAMILNGPQYDDSIADVVGYMYDAAIEVALSEEG